MQFIDTLGISKRDFYAQTGISRGTLESPTGITEETMAKFIAFYPNISPKWLLMGEGEALRQDDKSGQGEHQEQEHEAASTLLLKRVEELIIENYKLKRDLLRMLDQQEFQKSTNKSKK